MTTTQEEFLSMLDEWIEGTLSTDKEHDLFELIGSGRFDELIAGEIEEMMLCEMNKCFDALPPPIDHRDAVRRAWLRITEKIKHKPSDTMTDDEKTRYMRTALALVDISTNNFSAELMWRIFEALQEKQDQFSLRDASEIKALVKTRYEIKSKKDDLLFRENMREYIRDVLKKESENDIDKK